MTRFRYNFVISLAVAIMKGFGPAKLSFAEMPTWPTCLELARLVGKHYIFIHLLINPRRSELRNSHHGERRGQHFPMQKCGRRLDCSECVLEWRLNPS